MLTAFWYWLCWFCILGICIREGKLLVIIGSQMHWFCCCFFILKDPIFNFRKFNSRSSHWYIILFSSSFKYLKRKLIPRLNLNNRRGERNLTYFDEVLGHIQVNLIYVHTLLCVCVWGEKEREYFKNACNFFCIYSKCVCVLFLLSEWNEIKTRYKHIWCVFSIENYPWVHCSKVK